MDSDWTEGNVNRLLGVMHIGQALYGDQLLRSKMSEATVGINVFSAPAKFSDINRNFPVYELCETEAHNALTYTDTDALLKELFTEGQLASNDSLLKQTQAAIMLHEDVVMVLTHLANPAVVTTETKQVLLADGSEFRSKLNQQIQAVVNNGFEFDSVSKDLAKELGIKIPQAEQVKAAVVGASRASLTRNVAGAEDSINPVASEASRGWSSPRPTCFGGGK